MKRIIAKSVISVIVLLLLISCKKEHLLFQEQSKDWNVSGDANWNFHNDELVGNTNNQSGFLITKSSYKNFILELEFKPDSTINSGVFIRCKAQNINPSDCYELNIWDLHPDQNNRTGSIVTKVIPLTIVKTINKWNLYKIKAENNRIKVWINDTLTADMTNELLSDGYIGLQAKGTGEIRFRNIKILEENKQ